MDIKCIKCGEPWDVYGLNHGDVAAWEADSIKQGIGCPACLGEKKNELSIMEHMDNETSLEGNIIIESNKSYGPETDYVEICHCEECGEKYSIDVNKIYYSGKEKIIYGDLGFYCLNESSDIESYIKLESDWARIDGKLMCQTCFNKYQECDECGGLFHEDETFYIQNMDKVFCETCMNNIISHCESCEEDYRNTELQEFENQWLCPSCYKEAGVDCEICGNKVNENEVVYGKNDENCCSEKCADVTTS